MLCVLIMAGGIGSRFWPQSTEEKPKQFLKLLGEKTMIQMTYDRMKKIVDDNHIFIVIYCGLIVKISSFLFFYLPKYATIEISNFKPRSKPYGWTFTLGRY